MTERMEEETGFLGRWSRLKREARTEQPVGEPAEPEAPALPPAETAEAEVVEEEAPKLPSLDSLDSGSDYTGFLRPDVPAELRRQALRKAWASDPVIAGFRGFAEYDWDYNAPGYGALRPTDDIARLLDAVLPDEKREEEVVEEEVVVATQQSVEAEDLPTLPPPQPSPALGRPEPVRSRERELSARAAEFPLPPKAGEG